ncbi:MAG: ATP-binding protein [Chitinivibrionia bacterium]|nr:ATP-binding protein [Chitinivibrionia bacterium]
MDIRNRDGYIKWIDSVIDTEFVKVIAGVRRSGKSMILQMVRDYIISRNVASKNVMFLNFESNKLNSYKTSETLMEYILKQIGETKEKIYFLFDEIQEVDNWQKVVNGLRVDFNCEIYITGSNAMLLSGELATYLTGRYIELKVFPLSFKEYLQFTKTDVNSSKVDVKFKEYMEWGGFPMLPAIDDKLLKKAVLESIFDSVLLKDVMLRGVIKEKNVLLRITNYLLDTIGNPVSAQKIANFFTSSGLKTNHNSVAKYLNLLEEAFIFYKVDRYDVRGKNYLKTLGKYYAVDNGIRNIKLGKSGNLGSQIENIVYIELKRRGFDVFTGNIDGKEIDFVCFKNGDIQYYQITYQMPDNSREQDNLLLIKDNYKKTIITANRMDVGEVNGIEIVHIVDFLLEN